jgi:hypothetical protein
MQMNQYTHTHTHTHTHIHSHTTNMHTHTQINIQIATSFLFPDHGDMRYPVGKVPFGTLPQWHIHAPSSSTSSMLT